MIDKYIFLFIATISLLSPLHSQYLIEQNEQSRIKDNNVSVKTEWEHSVDNGTVDDKGIMTSVTRYAENGNVLEKISYRYNGDISSKENYAYDSKGNETEFTRYDGRQKEYTVKRYTKYNNKGLKVNENGLNGPDGPFSNYYKYNADDEISEIYYYASNKLIEKRTIEYDNDSREIKVYNGAGALTQRIVKKVDARDNLLEETTYSPDGKVTRKYVYQYDKNNNRILEEKYYGTNLRERLRKTYNSNNNLTKVIEEDGEGNSFTSKIFSYDSRGILIEEKWYNQGKDKFSSKRYKYNARGNLIEATCYFANFDSRYLYKYQYETH